LSVSQLASQLASQSVIVPAIHCQSVSYLASQLATQFQSVSQLDSKSVIDWQL